MKAVILAAGKGTRMRELTQAIPKPMLPVQGKPILQHILEGMVAAGIREFCIVTGYAADVVERYFANGEKFGARISYARQLVQDGTGKAPQLAKNFVGSDAFLLTYGDILVAPDIYKQMRTRFESGVFDGVIAVTAAEDITKGGLSFFDREFCLRKIAEKPSLAQVEQYQREGWLKPGEPGWYNGGIYIFKPLVFQFTNRLEKSPRGEYELTDAINHMVESGSKIAGLSVAGRLVDVRDPEVLSGLEKDSRAGTEIAK